ncbi:hypothetical protein SLEP1_g4730 [Rubroshorea leprosula]|uniref:Uncharacterized protein n=1 Tax=Rubroshorea leprosula TaxID=152421 RepID=A0AAV5HW13_9ROSI|nr:hypothetical protein SLEP1_g4730 [Rubroshorea leprosula]
MSGAAPPRGSAAATASMRRRRTSGGALGGPAGTMLQFYTDDAPRLKISPNVVLVMSIGHKHGLDVKVHLPKVGSEYEHQMRDPTMRSKACVQSALPQKTEMRGWNSVKPEQSTFIGRPSFIPQKVLY